MKTSSRKLIIVVICAVGIWSRFVHQSRPSSSTLMQMAPYELQLEDKSWSWRSIARKNLSPLNHIYKSWSYKFFVGHLHCYRSCWVTSIARVRIGSRFCLFPKGKLPEIWCWIYSFWKYMWFIDLLKTSMAIIFTLFHLLTHQLRKFMTAIPFYPSLFLRSAFYDCVQISVHGVQISVRTRRLAHGPFQLAVH
jgi:hypothetical protein